MTISEESSSTNPTPTPTPTPTTPTTKTKWYTAKEIKLHNAAEDCWVSINGSVFDLTNFLADNRGPLAQPIIENAGQNISSWFTKDNKVLTYVDPDRNLTLPYTPQGRFVHVPPPEPSASWSLDCVQWWKNEDLKIGKVSQTTRKINVVNTLTQQEHELNVCSEETIEEIQQRYLSFNGHAASYTWKRLDDKGEEFVVMDMSKTLEENGCMNEAGEFEKLQIPDDWYVPVMHIYFNDDLSVA